MIIDLTDNKPMRVRVAYAVNLHQVNIMVMEEDQGEKVAKQFYVDHCDIQCPCETELTNDLMGKKRMYMQAQCHIMERTTGKNGLTLILR